MTAASSASASARRAATLSYLRRQLGAAAGTVLVGAAMVVLGGYLIDRYTEAGGALAAVQVTCVLLGPATVLCALWWLLFLLSRRRQVRACTWVSHPARVDAMWWGPLRLTVLGIDLPAGPPFVLFPELPFRQRLRRQIARDGEVLVLQPPPGTLPPALYACASGAPLFTNQLLNAGPLQSGGQLFTALPARHRGWETPPWELPDNPADLPPD